MKNDKEDILALKTTTIQARNVCGYYTSDNSTPLNDGLLMSLAFFLLAKRMFTIIIVNIKL